MSILEIIQYHSISMYPPTRLQMSPAKNMKLHFPVFAFQQGLCAVLAGVSRFHTDLAKHDQFGTYDDGCTTPPKDAKDAMGVRIE